MRASDLVSPGPISNGQQLRVELAKALSREQVRKTQGAVYDNTLELFITNCLNVLYAVKGVPVNPVRALATFDPIFYNTDTHATYTGYCSYSSDTIGGGAATDLIASFNLWYIADSNNTGTDTEIPNGATVECVIQALGKSYQFTFGGATTKVLSAGANDVQSDMVSVQTAFQQASLPVGTVVKKKIKVILPAVGSVLPIGMKNTAYVNSDNAFWYDPATLTPHAIGTVGPWASTGTGFSNRTNPFSFRLLGKGVGQAMTVIGDSLTAGFKDTLTGNLFGSMHRGLATLPVPPAVISLAVSGVMSTYGSTSAKVSNLMKYATTALYLAPGTNDLPGVTAPVLITRIDQRIAQWKAAGGNGKVLVRRLFPRTGSSNSWADAAGQNVTTFAGWNAGQAAEIYNASLTKPKYDDVFTTTVSRDSAEPLKWVSNGTANYATTDGTHPTPALAALEAPLMASFFQANGIGVAA